MSDLVWLNHGKHVRETAIYPMFLGDFIEFSYFTSQFILVQICTPIFSSSSLSSFLTDNIKSLFIWTFLVYLLHRRRELRLH